MSFDFSGRVVVVTGAAVGYGRAIASTFASLGAKTYAVDKDDERLHGEKSFPANVRTRAVDITDRQAVNDLISTIETESGPVNVLVNNAGGTLGRTHVALEDTGFDDWDAIVNVNLNAPFALARAVVPGMKRSGNGRIINILSGASFRPSMTGVPAYTSSKHALLGLTRQLAHELGPFGINVNAVAPGLQPVSPATTQQWDSYSDQMRAEIVSKIPLRSLGTPQDVANAVIFLASDLASFVTAQVLPVNGGAW